MKIRYLLRAVAAVGFLALGIPACTTQEPEFIKQPAEEGALLSNAQLLRWYEAQAGSLKAESTASRATTPATAPALEWALATTTRVGTEHVTLVPFAGPTDQFDGSGYHGHRRLLIVQKARQQPKAAIIEVLATAPYAPAVAETLFLDLYRKGKTNAVFPQTTFTGFVFFYTLRYEPRAGKGYVQGRVVPGNPKLFHSGGPAGNKGGNTAQRVSTCTYTIISHSPPYTVSVCSGGGGGGGSSFGGGNDSGGYGNGPRPADYPEIPGDSDLNGDDGSNPGSVTTIISTLLPCVSPSLSSLQNLKGNDIGGLFQYFSTTPYSTWVIQSGNIPDDSDGRQRNALTSQSNGMPADYIVTTINNSFANTATDVAISRTLIHESMHAYLMLWAYSQGMDVNVTTSQLVDGYLGALNPNDSNGQHDAMVAIINQMAGALQMRFPTLPLEYAKNLFWAGLTGTREYASLSAAQKAAITAAATAELLSQATALGTKACN